MKIVIKIIIISLSILIMTNLIYTQSRRNTFINGNTSTIKGTSIKSDDNFGNYLADSDGYSLYVNVKDGQENIGCYTDTCIKKWPPAVIKSDQQLFITDDVNSDMLMTIKGEDGRNALTYNNWPLYYYVKDANPGDIKGVGLEASYYLISDKGVPLKPDERGRLPRPNAEREPTPAETAETSEETPSSSKSKSLLVSGLATTNIIPDLINVKLTLTSTADDLRSARNQMNSQLSKMNSTLIQIDPSDITLIDRNIYNNNNFIIIYNYLIIVRDEDKLKSLIDALKINNDSNPNDKIIYEVDYSVSNENLKKSKMFLFNLALKNALDNAYTSIEPVKMIIDKAKPFKNIKIDSSNLKSLIPFVTIEKPNMLIPSFNIDNEMAHTVKVTLTMNVA